MGALLSVLQLVGPVVLRGAESGTLVEIAETAAKLVALLRPLLADPQTKAALDEAAVTVAATTSIRPAQPEDPVFARQGSTHLGGR
jgi:hypothetical protein